MTTCPKKTLYNALETYHRVDSCPMICWSNYHLHTYMYIHLLSRCTSQPTVHITQLTPDKRSLLSPMPLRSGLLPDSNKSIQKECKSLEEKSTRHHVFISVCASAKHWRCQRHLTPNKGLYWCSILSQKDTPHSCCVKHSQRTPKSIYLNQQRQTLTLSLTQKEGMVKATTMRSLVSHHSVLSISTRAGGYHHYLLLWFPWLVGNLEQSKSQKQ